MDFDFSQKLRNQNFTFQRKKFQPNIRASIKEKEMKSQKKWETKKNIRF